MSAVSTSRPFIRTAFDRPFGETAGAAKGAPDFLLISPGRIPIIPPLF